MEDPTQLRLAKVFHESSHRITSLDFDPTGELCLVGCPEDESIILYHAVDGLHKKTIYSKKYGVGLVRFTHRANNVIYASGKGEDHALRYLSLHDNAYLRYFHGHQGRVSALEMSPQQDTFISGAADDTVRFWDLRSPNCQGILAVTGRPLVAFDPQGLVLAVALESRFLRLYDTKSYERGPFAAFEIVADAASRGTWNRITFSPDGKEIMISTLGGPVLLVDGFDGFVRQVLHGAQNSANLDLQPAYSASSRHILCGDPSGAINIWEREGGRLIGQLEGHTSYPQVIKCNPRFEMLASACTNLVS